MRRLLVLCTVLLSFIQLTGAAAAASCITQAFAEYLRPNQYQFAENPIFEQAHAYRIFDKAAIDELKAGKKLNYLIDINDHLHVTEEAIKPPGDSLWIVWNSAKRLIGEKDSGIFVKTAGELQLSDDKSALKLQTSYALDQSQEEVDNMLRVLGKESPELRFTTEKNVLWSATRKLDCAELLLEQQSGKNFIWDQMKGSFVINVVFGLALNPMDSAEDYKVLAADVGGNLATSAISASLSKMLVLKDTKLASAMFVRAGMGAGLTETRNMANRLIVGGTNEKKSDDIIQYNRAFFLVRLPLNQVIDQAFLKSIPEALHRACEKNGKLNIFFSPGSLRIYERFLSAGMYWAPRKIFVESDK